MRALDRKMWRDLWQLRGQAIAIILVIASGVATFVMFVTTNESLQLTRASYYRDYRFADVFVTMKRAPEQLRVRLAAIPGVDRVDTRVVAPVNVDLAGFPEPVSGLITSVPDSGEPLLNKLFMMEGRNVEEGRDDEVVVSEAFAKAHGFHPGDRLEVIIKGRRKALTIVGTAASPEYIHQLRPGGVFPDYERYAVMWMARSPLGSAYDMEGAFNSAVASIDREANVEDVIDRIDDLLAPYGATGAIARADQLSHRFLSEEFRQLATSARIFPAIFLGVAAFLLNVVVSRLISTQREQIASLKAFGYSNFAVALHYFKLVLVILGAGAALGVLCGAWLGHGLSSIYTQFFRLPYLVYLLPPAAIGKALLVSGGAALLGTLYAVRAAARLRPAQAMHAAAPTLYRQTLIERAGLRHLLSVPGLMILRHLARRPVKSSLTVLGIAMACAILMIGRFQENTVAYMLYVQYGLSQRDDLSVTFFEPTSWRAQYDLVNLPGVRRAEAFRSVPVRLRYQHRDYRTSILGLAPGGEIKRLLDTDLRHIVLPPDGLVLTDYLGELLGVRKGDVLTVEILEGNRPVREVPVVALVSQFLGVSGYMDLTALNALLREGNAISGAYLATDSRYTSALYARLKETPRIAGTVVRRHEIEGFYRTMQETLLFFVAVATLFAVIIAFGVVYNAARITLTERATELATLRVLGFTRGEISYILIGELAVLTLAAMPLGMLIGRGLCIYIATTLSNDLYRIVPILEPYTYAFAVLVVLLSALVSALVVRRRLDRLDLIAVLKSKE